jgi:mRNA interferase RelE/StbE
VGRAYVRFMDDAVEDLRALHRKDPQIVRAVLKKCLLLERNPEAGEALLGDLIGFRKLVVGDRDWRIVWRVTTSAEGDTVLDIAEVWAAGARADGEVYDEISSRLAEIGDAGLRHALQEVVNVLAPASGIEAAVEPATDPVPEWLRDRLVHTAGLDLHDVTMLTGEQAMRRWEKFITGQ